MRSNSFLLISLYIAACCILSGCGPQGCEWWDEVDSTNCYKVLKNSACFRIGGVGVAAATPPEQIALRILMEQGDAAVVLERLFLEGTTAAKLYALLDLRFVDRDVYEELLPQIRDKDILVPTMGGCIIDQESAIDIVKSIEAGGYDLYMERKL